MKRSFFAVASLCGALGLPLLGCGGSQAGSETPNGAAASADQEDGGAAGAEPAGPDCSDGTCFVCGEGICPSGAYCDENAKGGAACAWLAECAGETSCGCFTRVLGSDCNCSADSGGPNVSCP